MNHSSRFVIITGFSLMLFLLLLIIATGLNNMSSINDRMDKIVNVHNYKARQMSELRSIARERSLLFYHMLMVRDPFVIDENIQNASNYAGVFLKIKDELFAASSSIEERQKLDLMMENAIISTRAQQLVTNLLLAGKYDQANQIFQEKSLPAQAVAVSHYDTILNDNQRLASEAAIAAKSEYQRTYIFMLLLSGIVIIVGAVISVYVIRKSNKTEKSLLVLNLELERRVEDRTHALSEANESLQGTIQDLQATKTQLIQSEKMASLGNLVAGISHEINTPLGIGVTSATSLVEEVGNVEKQFNDGSMKRSDLEAFFAHAHKAGDILIKNLDRASNLIRSFKQVAVDQSSNDWRSVNFRKYFDEILISLHPQFRQTAISVENFTDENLKSFTHPGAIYQIISNLVLNALIHAFGDGRNGTIRITATQKDNEIEITCQDNGRGIPEQNIGRIFEPFFTTRRGSGGTGLGLNIVYNLVTTQLGGQINVESIAGSGTKFIIRFPMHLTQPTHTP